MQQDYSILKFGIDVYETIDFSMDREQILAVVFSKLFSVIDANIGIIQIFSSKGRKNYYGYSVIDGMCSWESDNKNLCPDNFNALFNKIQDAFSENENGCCIVTKDVAIKKFDKKSIIKGYIALLKDDKNKRAFDKNVLDIIKAVSNLIVTILNKQNKYREWMYSEELTIIKRVLSEVNHDIKSPLSGISGFTQMIYQKTEDKSIRNYCNIILDSLMQLESKSREILSIIENGQIVLDRKDIDLSVLIKEVVDESSEIFEGSGIDIRIKNGKNIMINADREKLAIVFNNILNNAIEAMSGDGKIYIHIDQCDSNARIEIKDNGKGIPAHIEGTVFQPFVKCGEIDTVGLGLTIAKRIIEEHDGAISVKSSQHNGTTVSIDLPIS